MTVGELKEKLSTIPDEVAIALYMVYHDEWGEAEVGAELTSINGDWEDGGMLTLCGNATAFGEEEEE